MLHASGASPPKPASASLAMVWSMIGREAAHGDRAEALGLGDAERGVEHRSTRRLRRPARRLRACGP
jgi:hypothetical protein